MRPITRFCGLKYNTYATVMFARTTYNAIEDERAPMHTNTYMYVPFTLALVADQSRGAAFSRRPFPIRPEFALSYAFECDMAQPIQKS
eukprot:1407834-Lingulodinium_polyedra.AAC.1